MRHKIILGGDVKLPRSTGRLIKKSIRAALNAEDVNVLCEINVWITDDEGIREINRQMRGVDAATDVLSFPMFELSAGAFDVSAAQTDINTGRLPLGDMTLNISRIRAQGEEYGHGERRECAYMTVHSILHLLGYDHLDEGEQKRQMRQREEEIMKKIKI